MMFILTDVWKHVLRPSAPVNYKLYAGYTQKNGAVKKLTISLFLTLYGHMLLQGHGTSFHGLELLVALSAKRDKQF
jgi:hypothetical protein